MNSLISWYCLRAPTIAEVLLRATPLCASDMHGEQTVDVHNDAQLLHFLLGNGIRVARRPLVSAFAEFWPADGGVEMTQSE